MADRKSSKPKKPKTARWQRIAMMDKEILDVEGAATLLGVLRGGFIREKARLNRCSAIPQPSPSLPGRGGLGNTE